ncbi:hypothetical protein [Planktotalea sp.]|uniref:hypothetical protein n=1 Tax=Planktotalea sp. TaxID=2029877 RepID=UPI003F6B198D
MHKLLNEIPKAWSAERRPTKEALENTELLLGRLKPLALLPLEADIGYWPTVALIWFDSPVQVQGFDFGYEIGVYPPFGSNFDYEIYEFHNGALKELDQVVTKLSLLMARDYDL